MLVSCYNKPVIFASSDLNAIEIANGPAQSELAGVGILVAFAMAWWFATRDRTPRSDVFATLGIAGAAALVGARAWALIESASSARAVDWIWNPFEPAGYASGGAFVGGALALLAARAVFGRASFARIVDVVLPAALLGLAFARVGCLFEGCDVGSETSGFGVSYPGADVSVHPFALYLALPTFVVALLSSLRKVAPGRRAVEVACAYGLIRFAAEIFRAASPTWWVGHLLAVLVAVAALGWWWLDGRVGVE